MDNFDVLKNMDNKMKDDSMDNFLQIAKDNGIELLEYTIDKITDSKIFDGFPIISQSLNVIKLVKIIPNFIYTKKLCAFLDGIINDNMDCHTFSKAMTELNKNPSQFEESLLFLIDKTENTEKAKLLGYFTRLLALRTITFDDFIFYSNVINNVQLQFLHTIANKHNDKKFIENSYLYGILLANGFSENGNGLHHENSTLTISIKFSEKLHTFGNLLNNYFEK